MAQVVELLDCRCKGFNSLEFGNITFFVGCVDAHTVGVEIGTVLILTSSLKRFFLKKSNCPYLGVFPEQLQLPLVPKEAAPVLHGQLFQPGVRLDDEGADGQGGVEAREDAPLQTVDPVLDGSKYKMTFFGDNVLFPHLKLSKSPVTATSSPPFGTLQEIVSKKDVYDNMTEQEQTLFKDLRW